MTDLPFPTLINSSAPVAAEVSVRSAHAEDAPAIAEVMFASWRESYADALADVLTELTADEATDQWRVSITVPPSTQHLILVALEGNEIVGYLLATPLEKGADVTTDTTVTEITDLVIHPDHTRRGHGSRLLAAAVDRMRGHDAIEAATWWVEGDSDRLSFLESAGFGDDGSRRQLTMGPGSLALIQRRFTALLH